MVVALDKSAIVTKAMMWTYDLEFESDELK